MNSFEAFTLAPMSAGDIIDRAVRLYRRNFQALLRIVLLPSLVAYTGVVLYYLGMRNFSMSRGDSRLALTLLLMFSGGMLYLIGQAAFYAMLGGASRSLVKHFFDGTPLRARDVFRSVRERAWSLIGATLMVALLILGFGMVIYLVVIILLLIYFALVATVTAGLPYWAQIAFNVIFGLFVLIIIVTTMLLIYGRLVYVPQVLMVERAGVFNSISRSFILAGGEVRRIGALILFWFYVAWSLWLLLMIPLGWYAYWIGVDINPFNPDEPLWYSIAKQTMTQLSEILIAPIAMLGFTLLYLDSRVRKEGFDVGILADRVLPPPPHIPTPQPISVSSPALVPSSGVPSILGLNDYTPTPVIPPLADSTPSEPVVSGPAARPQPEDSPRVCQWCGTEAGLEDRFCRLCGSVF